MERASQKLFFESRSENQPPATIPIVYHVITNLQCNYRTPEQMLLDGCGLVQADYPSAYAQASAQAKEFATEKYNLFPIQIHIGALPLAELEAKPNMAEWVAQFKMHFRLSDS